MSLKRWAARLLIGALAVPAFGGCKQQLFLEPGDYKDAVSAGLPPALDTNVHSTIFPPKVDDHATPATVDNPMRPPRYITLKECIAVALEQGNENGTSVNGFGSKNDNLLTRGGVARGVGADAVRAFALDPAASGADIERALSKFDARWITSMQWQKNDNPVAAQFVSFQSQNDQANFSTTLAKFLPTGGVAGITASMNYAKFSNIPANQQASFVNPNYTPQLLFQFEQPLLQMFGVEVNQMSQRLAQPLTINGLSANGGQSFFGSGVEGILVTRIRYDQSLSEFERRINNTLMGTEAAYWRLYQAYYSLYAAEEGLRLAMKNWVFIKARVQAGNVPPQREYQALAQVEQFRSQVVAARGRVLEADRSLRGYMGMRSDDNCRLVPVDQPTLAEFKPDFYEAANETMIHRPELMIARQEVKAVQFNLALLRNVRQPDLRFFSSYNIQGIGTRLDGSELVGNNNTLPGNALASAANNQFNSWTLGLRMDMPLGFRDANALVRQGTLDLTRTYYQLRDSELKALEYLNGRYRNIVESHKQIAYTKARRIWLQLFIEKTDEVIAIGRWNDDEYYNLIQVQQQLAVAIDAEFQAIANYNIALAEFEYAKGTILQYNNVSLAEGPLPPWVAKRAADREKERAAGLKLRERPNSFNTADAANSHTVGPAVGMPFCTDLPNITQMPVPGADALGTQPSDSMKPPAPKSYPSLPAPKVMPEPNPGPGARNPMPQPGSPMPSYPVNAVVPGSVDVQSEGNVVIPPARLPQRFTPATSETNPLPMSSGNATFPPLASSAPPVPQPASGSGIPATLPTNVPTISSLPNGGR